MLRAPVPPSSCPAVTSAPATSSPGPTLPSRPTLSPRRPTSPGPTRRPLPPSTRSHRAPSRSATSGAPSALNLLAILACSECSKHCPGKASSPCPSSASEALVYAYAPVNPTTTPAELSTSPGGSSPWRPLAEVDCDGDYPAVGGGPSGLGLLETNEAHVPNPGPVVQYRHFSPSSGFGSAVTLATGEVGMDATLSQDSAGDIFATWLDNATGVDLAYSSDGGATWSKPKILFSNAGNPSAISLLSSAVGSPGQGWAVYAVGKREYAQRFSKS